MSATEIKRALDAGRAEVAKYKAERLEAQAQRECITHTLDSFHDTVCFERDLWEWWLVHGPWDGRSSRWSLTKPDERTQ